MKYKYPWYNQPIDSFLSPNIHTAGHRNHIDEVNEAGLVKTACLTHYLGNGRRYGSRYYQSLIRRRILALTSASVTFSDFIVCCISFGIESAVTVRHLITVSR